MISIKKCWLRYSGHTSLLIKTKIKITILWSVVSAWKSTMRARSNCWELHAITYTMVHAWMIHLTLNWKLYSVVSLRMINLMVKLTVLYATRDLYKLQYSIRYSSRWQKQVNYHKINKSCSTSKEYNQLPLWVIVTSILKFCLLKIFNSLHGQLDQGQEGQIRISKITQIWL